MFKLKKGCEMKITLKIASAIALLLFTLTGCGTGAIYNVPEKPLAVNSQNITQEDVFKAIFRAGAGLGWQIVKKEDGVAMGTLYLRSHTAVIEIPYTANSYSIQYKSSVDLNYNAEKQTIHTNYNGWIQNLDKAIQIQVSTL